MTLPTIEHELARRGIQLKRSGRDLTGPCPVCGGRDRFVVTPRKNVWLCRGCSAGGDVIDMVRHIDGCSYPDALRTLGAEASRPVRRAPPPVSHDKPAGGLFIAARLWAQSMPIAGTPGADWIAARGIDLSVAPDDAGMRFHPACPYGDGRRVPAILTRFTDILTGAERGIHRRAITAGVEHKTMTLGPCGGAVVRLWPDEDVVHGLVIGEGVETTLAAATRITHRGTLLQPAWACGSAGTLANFPVLPGIEALTILADSDESGAGQRAADQCARRWAAAGREVEILTPRALGMDMNDIVMGAA